MKSNRLTDCFNGEVISSSADLDRLIDFYIDSLDSEKLWRILLAFGNYDYCFTKIIDYFIKIKSVYYLMEAIYVLNDRLNICNLYYKVKELDDDKFFKDFVDEVKFYLVVSDDDSLEKVLERYQ